ncbi:hypothetical protein [Streptomyces sp. 147326]|uniref:hypothetical protein n=1 Tax=Streptomyces sp. 147326 TaxID=3074379 RepID=UPI0038579AC7
MPPLEEWVIERAGRNVLFTGTIYAYLKNTHINRYLIYAERRSAIDLAWTDNGGRATISFGDPFSPRVEVKFGQAIPIAINGGGYLRYRRRSFLGGISLGWSNSPIAEWILTGGPAGTNVPVNSPFGLFNTATSSHLVHCWQFFSIALKWSKNCNRLGAPTPTAPAYVSINYRTPLGGGGTQPSTGSVTFSGQLTSPAGTSDMGETSFQQTDRWEAQPGATSGNAQVNLSNLKAGTWRVEARSPLWYAVCDVVLAAGRNEFINFQQNRNGCTRGIEFP